MLEESLSKRGAGRSALSDRNGVMIAGNKAWEVASEIGLPIREVHTDGSELVVVVRDDLDLEHDERARILAYEDNRIGQASLEWDPAILLEDQAVLAGAPGLFSKEEMRALLPPPQGEDPDRPVRFDQAQVLREKWGVEKGQVWVVEGAGGAHRMMCGDSTSPLDVEALLQGEVPHLMVTDPPYGVEYRPAWRDEKLGTADRRTGTVPGDQSFEWRAAYALFRGEVAYVWHASYHVGAVQHQLEEVGFSMKAQLIWVKPRPALSRGHYNWQHEPCWYARRDEHPALWIGGNSESTVWPITPLPDEGGAEHGTQKPLECMQRPIRNHQGDVYDPFLGTGTTVVAAELERRRSWSMEISPEYLAVALQRLEDMGLRPTPTDNVVS